MASLQRWMRAGPGSPLSSRRGDSRIASSARGTSPPAAAAANSAGRPLSRNTTSAAQPASTPRPPARDVDAYSPAPSATTPSHHAKTNSPPRSAREIASGTAIAMSAARIPALPTLPSGRKGTLVTSCCRASRLAMLVPSTNAATRRSRDVSSRRSQTGSAASTRYASLSGSDSYRRYEPAKLVAGDTEKPKASAAAAAAATRGQRSRPRDGRSGVSSARPAPRHAPAITRDALGRMNWSIRLGRKKTGRPNATTTGSTVPKRADHHPADHSDVARQEGDRDLLRRGAAHGPQLRRHRAPAARPAHRGRGHRGSRARGPGRDAREGSL